MTTLGSGIGGPEKQQEGSDRDRGVLEKVGGDHGSNREWQGQQSVELAFCLQSAHDDTVPVTEAVPESEPVATALAVDESVAEAVGEAVLVAFKGFAYVPEADGRASDPVNDGKEYDEPAEDAEAADAHIPLMYWVAASSSEVCESLAGDD